MKKGVCNLHLIWSSLILLCIVCCGTDSDFRITKEFADAINQYLIVGGGKFSEGAVGIYLGFGQEGFIDKTGKQIVPCVYDRVRSFSEGLAGVHQNGKGGFVNKSGELVIPCIYDAISDFSERTAAIKVSGLCGSKEKVFRYA